MDYSQSLVVSSWILDDPKRPDSFAVQVYHPTEQDLQMESHHEFDVAFETAYAQIPKKFWTPNRIHYYYRSPLMKYCTSLLTLDANRIRQQIANQSAYKNPYWIAKEEQGFTDYPYVLDRVPSNWVWDGVLIWETIPLEQLPKQVYCLLGISLRTRKILGNITNVTFETSPAMDFCIHSQLGTSTCEPVYSMTGNHVFYLIDQDDHLDVRCQKILRISDETYHYLNLIEDVKR